MNGFFLILIILLFTRNNLKTITQHQNTTPEPPKKPATPPVHIQKSPETPANHAGSALEPSQNRTQPPKKERRGG